MCLGIPGLVVDLSTQHPDLARVDVEGVIRDINMALLEDDPAVPGDWILIHLGFALQKMTEAEVAGRALDPVPSWARVGCDDDPFAGVHASTSNPTSRSCPGSRQLNPLADATMTVARACPLPRGCPDSKSLSRRVTNGAILFARYAYPPNELGYCGPPDHEALLQYGADRTVDAGLVAAGAGLRRGVAVPRVHRRRDRHPRRRSTGASSRPTGSAASCWTRIDMVALRQLADRTVPQARRQGLGLPGRGHPGGRRAQPRVPRLRRLSVGRACSGPAGRRHRSSTSTSAGSAGARWSSVDGDQVTVLSRPADLRRHGHRPRRAAPGDGQRARSTALGFLDSFRPGDWVSLHWGWVCDRLSRRQLHLLQRSTMRQFEITNRRVVHSGPRNAIG